MKSGQKVRPRQKKRKQGQAAALNSLSGHRLFAPLLGLWGALLGGLVVIVIPSALVENALEGTLIGTWDIDAQLLLAAIAAIMLGLLLFSVAAEMHSRARRSASMPSVVELAMRRGVTPINPARDLGTRSLDDPLDAMPFTTPAWRDADLDDPHRAAAPVPPPAQEPVPAPQPETAVASAPIELDLAQFAELPNRNAVWVDEVPSAAEPAAEPTAAEPDPVADIRTRRLRAVAPLPPAPGAAALARLRAMPASELSLAEMVERFAAALHEHRETPPAQTLSRADFAAREAALAEALKALAALSGDGPEAARPSREEPLRAALAQLHAQRGVA